MNHGILARMYLRQYAFLVRGRPNMPSRVAFNFSAMAVSGLISMVALTILALALWLLSKVSGEPVAFWTAPDWVVMIVATGIVFIPGLYVDRKMKAFRAVDRNVLDFYSTRHQRCLWLLTILSIVPLAVIVGLCLSSIRAGA